MNGVITFGLANGIAKNWAKIRESLSLQNLMQQKYVSLLCKVSVYSRFNFVAAKKRADQFNIGRP